MQIDAVTMEQNKLLQDYLRGENTILQRFDYNPNDKGIWLERLKDIQKVDYQRGQLVEVLTKLHKKWDQDDLVLANIQRLNDANSVVVIGGQQAGLLTGPLYTIHKIISIIVFARQQEEILKVPVIPVFWIAGEDHDFAEINHIFLPNQNEMKKYPLWQSDHEKKSVSSIEINYEALDEWLDRLFVELTETAYSKPLYNQLKSIAKDSVTYVDFFAKLTNQLFAQQGLVLIDSGDPEVRKIETTYFQQLIMKQPQISQGVNRTLQQVRQDGYLISVDADEDDGHLFYHKNGKRVLLEKVAKDHWQDKHKTCEFTTEELLEIAREQPGNLSNNVVTRPVMQECLFPTLAFFAGPGELAYWSILKPAFHAIGYKMPPVIPRLSFTIIDRTIEKKIAKHHLEFEQLLSSGATNAKLTWLAGQCEPPLIPLITEVKRAIDQAHQPLRHLANEMDADLGEMAEKNLIYLYQQIDFLQKAMEKRLSDKHKRTLDEFDRVELVVHPNNGLQERCWNIVSFLNQYGSDWLTKLMKENYQFGQGHYIVKL
ncbi:bacillithiol biosynthesis cysteine-adding enzyme BshC [Natronobacillus azotifigens]|uniref:Putative cysteine ligase BshC n=1 Tax=Natronobacillus azotifigens TaxID=472978 RepID=A0A9J6RG36_9BACI|nr:bacillithiol biosynthesis cysteine-adding enzyme BshC [Natronobacillus azotifigens]MCZ0704527.1 bacillithiol biosynthesis cysteine-adding enzyme BshC [Natronobacillus azotifigens]